MGSIEPGKLADLVVWDENVDEVTTDELEDLECRMTLFKGEIVYQRPVSRIRVSGGAP